MRALICIILIHISISRPNFCVLFVSPPTSCIYRAITELRLNAQPLSKKMGEFLVDYSERQNAMIKLKEEKDKLENLHRQIEKRRAYLKSKSDGLVDYMNLLKQGNESSQNRKAVELSAQRQAEVLMDSNLVTTAHKNIVQGEDNE